MKNFTFLTSSNKAILAALLVGCCFTQQVGISQNTSRAIISFSSHSEQSLNLNQKQILDQKVASYSVYNIDHKAIYNQVQQSGSVSFNLNLDGKDYVFELEPNEVRTEDYKLVAYNNGIFTEIPRGPVKTYKGYVNGNINNDVRMSITENFISALFYENGKTMHLKAVDELTGESVNADNKYILYKEADLKSEAIQCVTKVDNAPTIEGTQFSSLATNCINANLVLVARNDLKVQRGSVAATEEILVTKVNEIKNLYNAAPVGSGANPPQLNIRHFISGMIVLEDPNLLIVAGTGNAASSALLNDFVVWGQTPGNISATFQYDLAVLFVPKQYGAIAGEAKAYSVTKSTKYVWTSIEGGTGTFAHELGHAWGAGSHDDATTCPAFDCVMRTNVPATAPGMSQWSTRSISEINTYLGTISSAIKTCDTGKPGAGFGFVSSTQPLSSCTGSLKVDFKDASRGIPTSWLWEFGDGSSSTLQNPTHTYTTAGKFTLKYTVSNASGSTTRTELDLFSVGTGTPWTSQSIVDLKTQGAGATPTGLGKYMNLIIDKELTLLTAKVYAPAAGVYAFGFGQNNVYDDNSQKNRALVQGINTVTLNFTFRPGEYQLWFPQLNSPSQVLIESTSPAYPFITAGALTITDKTTGYFAYDMVILKAGCDDGTSVIEEGNEKSNLIKVYPNPGEGTFTVKLSNNGNHTSSISVYNIIGENVYTLNNITGEEAKVNLKHLEAGTYILKVSGKDEQNVKIIIND